MKPIALVTLACVLAAALYVMFSARVDTGATVDALRDAQADEQGPVLSTPATPVLERSVAVESSETAEASADPELIPNPAAAEAAVEVTGRVVTPEGTPIYGARVFVSHVEGFRSRERSVALPPAAPPDAISDANGNFRVPIRDGVTTLGTILAEGRAPRIAILGEAPIDAPVQDGVDNGPIEILLLPSARAEGVVVGAPSGSIIRAVAPAYNLQSDADIDRRLLSYDVMIEGAVGPLGEVALEDLPPGSPLRLELHDPAEHAVLLQEPEPVMLAPGSTHRIDWRLEGGGRIVCVLHESDGQPAPRIGVWLLTSDEGRRGRALRYWKPTQEGESDRDGRVNFVNLRPGKWIVALDPKRNSSDYAAFAVEVVVPQSGGDVTVDLTVSRGLHIGGALLDPDGTPCAGYVLASTPGFSERSTVGADGKFLIGPLVAGEYGLTADNRSGSGRPFARADRVEATAGDLDVTLQFNPGATLKLSAIDTATGDPVAAMFAAATVGQRFGTTMSGNLSKHREFKGRPVGTHVAIATTPDGRAGMVEGIVLAAYETREVEIPLQAAGFVRVRYTGPEPYLQCTVRRNRASLAFDTALSGGDALITLPPGSVTIDLRIYDRSSNERPAPLLFDESRDVDVVAGEEVVIEILR